MKKLFLALSVLLFATGALFAQSDLQVLSVVKYNKSESITVKQLKSRCASYEKKLGTTLTLDDKKKVLEALIEEKLILQAAAKEGITIADSTVDQYFDANLSQQVGANLTEKQFNDLLIQQQGITLDDYLMNQLGMNTAEYKQYYKNQLIAQQYVMYKKQAEIQQLAPSDNDIRLFYEANKSQFVWNDMAKFLLVLVPKDSNSDVAKNKINELRNKYVDKKLNSSQIVAQCQAANAGYQAAEVLLPKTEAGANAVNLTLQSFIGMFDQKEGFVSEVHETSSDYRFISIGKKYDAKFLTLSDVVTPETTVTVYEYIRQLLGQQNVQSYIQLAATEIAKELNVPDYVENKKTGAALDKLLNWGE